MKASSVSFTGSIPKNYDHYLGPFLFEPYALDLIARIKNKSAQTILELACGTGRVTGHLRTVLTENAKLFATDLNPAMIELAKKRVPAKNVEWKIVDMMSIPFESDYFDLIVCQFGIMFVPDKLKAFQEIHRVLKKGGLFLFNTWDNLTNNPSAFLVDQKINSFFPGNPVPFYQIPFSFHNPTEIEQLLKRAGFFKFGIESVKKEGVSESADNAAQGWIEGNPAYAYICERDASLIPTIHETLMKGLQENFGDHPIRIPMQAFVGEVVK